jgi:tetratricopeptide (TPR) repeat protein
MKGGAACWFWLGMCSAAFASAAHAQNAPTATINATPLPVPEADSARKAEAEQSRLHALSLYDSGDYAGARAEFAHANQLFPSYRLLYNLGVVSLDLADPATAYDYFERFLAEGGELIPAEKRSETLEQLHQLSARVATVSVYADAPGAEVLIDERSAGTAPVVIHVNPGAHDIRARRDGQSRRPERLQLAAGESIRVQLRLGVPAAHRPSSVLHPQVFWPGWAGTAAFTAGAVFAGFEALSAQHEYNRRFDTISSRAELDRLDRNTTRWSVTADALGGAALVLGSYSLYMTLRHARTTADGANGSGKFSVQALSNQARATVSF